MYEVQVVQPRDRQDWIAGVRRAVDLSAGGPGEDGQFETEAERARKQLEAKYMKMRQLTSELRGKDMEQQFGRCFLRSRLPCTSCWLPPIAHG